MTHISPETDIAIAHTTRAWTWFAADRNLTARIPRWELGTATDGAPLVSFQVVGPEPEDALTLFAKVPEYLRSLNPDDIRPVFDYSVPGRVVCVWRTGGVWVELWHPDTVTSSPEPAQATPGPSPRGLLGGRLPFPRNRKTAA